MNPQADDIGRSLLEFCDGKPLGESGVLWLKIHSANLFGECRGALIERGDWTSQNSARICESAANPHRSRWWRKANKPWRFLAARFEWQTFCANCPGTLSQLPILVDGTCNGFQHLNALLLKGLEGGTTPWYPTMRLFRQPALGDWEAVIPKVARFLTAAAKRGVELETRVENPHGPL